MAGRNYYDILRIARDASDEEIRRAYRRMAFACHPDRNPEDGDAERKFREAAEAYAVLGDPDRRAEYDLRAARQAELLAFARGAGLEEVVVGQPSAWADPPPGRTRVGVEADRFRAGADLRCDLTLTRREALRGGPMTLRIRREGLCQACAGRGGLPGVRVEACGRCGGAGRIVHARGLFRLSLLCPSCGGQGRVIVNRCPVCRGRGLATESRELVLDLPPCVRHGEVFSLPGEGEPGFGGAPAGDLFVVVRVRDDVLRRLHDRDQAFNATYPWIRR